MRAFPGWGREILHDVGIGLCVLASATQKARQGENGLRVRAGIVPMEEDAVRLVQRNSYISATYGMLVLDTDASLVAISGILHHEQEWNGRTVLRPIADGSEVLSDTEMKYGAPKAEMFAVITVVDQYRAYLRNAPFKLRVENRALAWLKTYSMDQSYIGRWIVRLDGYRMIIEHRTRDKHQNADSLSKKDRIV